MSNEPESILSLEDTAKMLGVDKHKLRLDVSNNKGPVPFGANPYTFKLYVVEAFMATQA